MSRAQDRRAARVARLLATMEKGFDARIATFSALLYELMAGIQARVSARIVADLTGSPGPRETMAALGQLNRLISTEVQGADVRALFEQFAAGLPGAFGAFDVMADALGVPKRGPLPPDDLAALEAQLIGTAEMLGDTLQAGATVAATAARRGGPLQKPAEVLEIISGHLAKAVAQIVTAADTSQVVFYRTVTAMNFRQIERGLPAGSVRYTFEGPNDKLTRPFCKELLSRTAKQPLTRAEIENLDNGQLPNPFVTGGGFNCRHQWIIEPLQVERPSKAKRTSAG